MATPDLTAGTVMDTAASLLNDTAKSRYTYAVQIPYLGAALKELQEIFELNEVPVVDTVSAIINIPAGYDNISFSAISPAPALPADMIEPKVLWERTEGTNPFVPMQKVDFLPRWMEGTEISQFQFFTWQDQEIRFFAANMDNDIKMDYIRDLFTPPFDQNSQLGIINAESFLHFRTAALCAQFIGENPSRADALNADAGLALDRVLGIGAKGRQSITIRRRPFRSSFKRRSFM